MSESEGPKIKKANIRLTDGSHVKGQINIKDHDRLSDLHQFRRRPFYRLIQCYNPWRSWWKGNFRKQESDSVDLPRRLNITIVRYSFASKSKDQRNQLYLGKIRAGVFVF